MSKNKHTPGPWALGFSNLRGGVYWHVERNDEYEPIDIHQDENGEADARLIAAAPDLFGYAKLMAANGDPDAIELVAQVEGSSP